MAYIWMHCKVVVDLGAQYKAIILHSVGSHFVFSLSGDRTAYTYCEDQEEISPGKQYDIVWSNGLASYNYC